VGSSSPSVYCRVSYNALTVGETEVRFHLRGRVRSLDFVKIILFSLSREVHNENNEDPAIPNMETKKE